MGGDRLKDKDCVFCKLLENPDRSVLRSGEFWSGFRPIGPVNDGHILLIPNRHFARMEALSPDEAAELPIALNQMLFAYDISDYNLGVNAGRIAGQTVFHLHIHVIPREAGDVADPAGGIIAPLGRQFKGSQFDTYLRERGSHGVHTRAGAAG
jgi:diadenosine tetraphosphate (Ap4A) HIT family hydrolase